jgi:hypothetical protein
MACVLVGDIVHSFNTRDKVYCSGVSSQMRSFRFSMLYGHYQIRHRNIVHVSSIFNPLWCENEIVVFLLGHRCVTARRGLAVRALKTSTDVCLFSRSAPEHVRLHVCILAAFRQWGRLMHKLVRSVIPWTEV